jgi:hypothetical protein
MDFRTSDILILFGLVLAVAAAGDLTRRNPAFGLGALVLVVVVAYTTGLRRGAKRTKN